MSTCLTCQQGGHQIVSQGRRLNIRDEDGGGGASSGGTCNWAQRGGRGEEGGGGGPDEGGGGGGDEGEGGGGDDPLGLHHGKIGRRQVLRYGDGGT